MSFTPKTVALFAIAVVLALLNLVDPGSARREGDQLPVLPALQRDDVSRIELSGAAEKVVLSREAQGRWRLVAPIEADADQILVRTLLTVFRKEIPIDVQVDVGNYEDYGLDTSNGVVAEFWTTGDEPVISMTVGFDTSAGSSFLRMSGSESIYRARVGGHQRYAAESNTWRNKVLLDFEREEVGSMSLLTPGQDPVVLVRGPSTQTGKDGSPIPGAWQLDPPTEWPLDQRLVDSLAYTLGQLRAGAILPGDFDGGFDPPLAEVVIVLQDGTTMKLQAGSKTETGYARVVGRDEVYVVAKSRLEVLAMPREEWRDKTLLSVPMELVDTIFLDSEGTSIVLRQDLVTASWSVVQPDNMALDIGVVRKAARTLSDLRAVVVASDVSPDDAGFDEADLLVGVSLVDGRRLGLQLGGEVVYGSGLMGRYIRRQDSTQVFIVDDSVAALLLNAFGRN